ncbi:MAG: hypothetical protein LBR22_06810 [Desulfovibrio sp.]|nr:hypothetical protein [Desulfovibrio sp.]
MDEPSGVPFLCIGRRSMPGVCLLSDTPFMEDSGTLTVPRRILAFRFGMDRSAFLTWGFLHRLRCDRRK